MVFVNIVGGRLSRAAVRRGTRSGTGREMGLLAADEFVNKKLVRVGA
jgi:succinate-semialdehyde dehydrogenase/glutarate-semialdehyde dehydrogenase